jgi:putative spermidine/putrescine transport system ATP-binding protein
MIQPASTVLHTEAADIELVHVSKQYGDALAVNAIDLRIPGGQYCCLLGPSGCGKTSTLRMIAGHESVTEGDVLIAGRNVTREEPAARGTAMVFQSYALFPHLSALDNVAFSLKMRGVAKDARRKRAGELLELVAMSAYAERKPAQLSGGQQQRVPCSTSRAACCSMNRSLRSTRSCACRCAPNSSAGKRSSVSPSCMSRTPRKKRWHWPISSS